MTQMTHNSKQISRQGNSTRISLADAMLCVNCFKGNDVEWYRAPGVEGEVRLMRRR